MIDKISALPTQIRQLEKRLKDMDASKVKPSMLKEITDTINNLKSLLKEKLEKKEQRKKQKEDASKEVSKEADAGSISTTTMSPSAPQAPGAATAPTSTTTPAATPDDQKSSCALCGGLTFPDYPSYQQHMEFTHASDIMPTTPGQKEDKLVASIEPVAEKEEGPKFKLDDVVKPVRGAESTGKVMRWDGKPSDLVYVAWDSGPLSERDTFGGYYPHDLELFQEEPVEAMAASMEKPACADCTSMKEKHSDLKNNYDALLKDLKEERDIHYEQGNSKWVARLDQKIRDLEKAIADKFGGEKTAGAQNDQEHLTVMDHTPPRANSGPDAGGKDSHDEFQDEWAMPAGIEMESAKGAPHSLFDAKSAPHVVEVLNGNINAPYVNAYPSSLGGEENVSILLTISADPKEKWANGILQNSRYGNFHIYHDGTVEQFSGAFAGWKQPNRAFRKSHVNNVEQLVGVLNDFLAKVNSTPAPAPAAAPKTSSLSAPVTEPTKLNVFNKEFIATPVTTNKKFGGYDISQNGKKILNIKLKDSQPMTKDQLEFCAKIELTRGLKQAKLVEKVAFLQSGTKVFILATDKSGKRTKIASLEHGLRGWVPTSKLQVKALESQSVKHGEHSDKILGQTATETLLDCIEGGPKWVSSTELLESNRPPATPESLNDLESEKQCPDCHGTFEGAEGETCPTCGRFAVQKTALKPALPPQILNRRMEVDASGCDQCAATMINGVFCHETGCPNQKRKNRFEDEDMDVDSSLHKAATDWEEGFTYVKNCKSCGDRHLVNENGFCIKCSKATKNSSLKIQAHIRHEDGKWVVWNHDYTKRLGTYPTKEQATKRLRQIEYFKHQGSLRPFSKKADYFDPEWTTKKVGEFYEEMMAEKFMMDNHLENGFYRKEGNKYVVYTDVPISSMSSKKKAEISEDMCFECGSKAHLDKEDENRKYYTCPKCNSGFVSKKHVPIWNYKKKAEVLSNPYQSLTDHITDMKSRMNQVQDRLQTAPVVKAAVEDAASEMDLPGLFADLTQGIELLETKLGGDENSDPEVHMGVEELENKLWELEEKLGLTPELSEHEKSESEHKEIVDDIEDKKKVNKSAIDVQVTDETLEEGTGTPPSTTIPATTTPVIQNVQPTDDDNLNVPVTMPSSPTPPGTKWVFDTQFNKYVIMPDGSNPGKTI